MATKFSQFTTGIAPVDATTFLVGYESVANTNNQYSKSDLATWLTSGAGAITTLYAGDGTIGAARVATITDTPKFQGDESTNIGLEVNNQYNSSMSPSSGGSKILLSSGTSGVTTLELRANRTGNGGSNASQTQINSSGTLVFSATNTTGWMYQWTTGSLGSLAFYGDNSGSVLRIASNGGATPNRIDLGWTGSSSAYIGTTGSEISLGKNNSGTLSEYLTIGSSGNVGIGATIDTGVTLKVDASGPDDQMAIIAKGRDQAAGDYSLICQDSAATNLFIVENDGLVTVGKNLKISGQGYSELHTGPTDMTFSWNDSNVQSTTMGASTPTFVPTNPKAGATYILTLIQTGAVTVNWNSLVKWPGGSAPTLSGSGKTDVVTLICYDATGAGLYYGSATLDLA